MRVLHQVCAGMDVHKKDVKVCLVTRDQQGQRQQEIRTFRTMTSELLALRDWLQDHGCKHVVMESTGVYWKRNQRHLIRHHMRRLEALGFKVELQELPQTT